MTDMKDTSPGASAAQRAREELYGTLGQLRERLDYAQRIDNSVERIKAQVLDAKKESPAVFFVGVAGAAAAAGLVVWGVARKVFRSTS